MNQTEDLLQMFQTKVFSKTCVYTNFSIRKNTTTRKTKIV